MSHRVTFQGTFQCSTKDEAMHLGETLADMLRQVGETTHAAAQAQVSVFDDQMAWDFSLTQPAN